MLTVLTPYFKLHNSCNLETFPTPLLFHFFGMTLVYLYKSHVSNPHYKLSVFLNKSTVSTKLSTFGNNVTNCKKSLSFLPNLHK